jgi:hypothetical protein
VLEPKRFAAGENVILTKNNVFIQLKPAGKVLRNGCIYRRDETIIRLDVDRGTPRIYERGHGL